MLSATGKVTWLRFCGGHEKFCQTIQPNKFESNSREGGTYAGRFAFENFNSTLFAVTGQVEEGQANEAQDDESVASTLPDDLSDDMTEVPDPLLSPFLFEKKTVHPKKPDLRLAGCA